MKVKNVATGCNRKQLKIKCLELAALSNWRDLKLTAANKEMEKLSSEINELQSKFDLSEKMLKDTTDKLITQKRITEEATKGNEEMAKDYYNQSKDVNRLMDLVVAANAEIERRDAIVNNLNYTISVLQVKVLDLSEEVGNLKQPFWKKLFK